MAQLVPTQNAERLEGAPAHVAAVGPLVAVLVGGVQLQVVQRDKSDGASRLGSGPVRQPTGMA